MAKRPATHRHRLDPKQTAALVALLEGASIEQAAERAGVHRSTVWRWRTEPGAFRRAIFHAEAEAVNRAARYLAQIAPAAAATLGHLLTPQKPATDAEGNPLMDGDGNPVLEGTVDSVRARAALGVLRELREYALVAPLLESELPAGDTAPYPSKPLPYQEAEAVLFTLASGRGLERRPDAEEPAEPATNGHGPFPWEQR